MMRNWRSSLEIWLISAGIAVAVLMMLTLAVRYPSLLSYGPTKQTIESQGPAQSAGTPLSGSTQPSGALR